MARSPIRFRPPRLAVSPEVRWILLRAFGPAEALAPVAPDSAAALAAARLFELSPRIAARRGRAALAAELGAEAAAGFVRDRATAAAVGVRLGEAAAEVAVAAEGIGCPVVFLKFMALQAGGHLAAGSRAACDLDVLAPAARARDLAAALAARGYRPSAGPGEEHQLPPLAGPLGAVVEVHLHLPGVRLGPGRAAAGLDDLARLGLLHPLAEFAGAASAPVPTVLAAHALVHGLAQHGGAPRAYSLAKTFADLIDLGLAGPGGEDLLRRLLPWVVRDLAETEVAAARDLCAALARGEEPNMEPNKESPAGLLLRHALAGRLDERYARALKLSLFGAQPSELAAPARLGRSLWRALALSRAQVDAIYGPPAGRLGYLGRRLWRPFDLAGRLIRYGASSLALPRGGPAGDSDDIGAIGKMGEIGKAEGAPHR